MYKPPVNYWRFRFLECPDANCSLQAYSTYLFLMTAPDLLQVLHMTTTIPLTISGAEKLRAELQRLKTQDRPAVIAAIAEARSHGDLSENAEYEAAKDRQGFIEGRIKEIEGKLSIAKIINPAELDADGRVVFGATVDLEEEDTGTTVTYQIVGEDEADIKQGLLNISSPIARALIGKTEGDVVEVQVPGGIRCYDIVGVRYE